MVHGQPDFGLNAYKATIYALADMGELAARLGSIVTFDRRGDVVWLDDFEGDIDKWFKFELGTGAAVALSPEAARSGALSAKLTTGDSDGNITYMARYCNPTVLGRLGFEVSFTVNDDLEEIVFYLIRHDGVDAHQASLKYLPADDKLQYLDSTNNWQDLITSLVLGPGSYKWHTIKLVADVENDKYVRCLLDHQAVDMSAYDLYVPESEVAAATFVEVLVITANDANNSIHVDDVIITQNEP